MGYRICSSWKRHPGLLATLLCLLIILMINNNQNNYATESISQKLTPGESSLASIRWADVPLNYPVARERMLPLPASGSKVMPTIQNAFDKEMSQEKKQRLERLEQIRSNFTHAWTGYSKGAWLHDELLPLTRGARDPFGGWADTLVSSLDTLFIMGLTREFDRAVAALDQIDFSRTALEEVGVFETARRFLAGLLAAYDVSGGPHGKHAKVLLDKAIDLGDMLYVAFDTPNRMPIARWKLKQLVATLRGVPKQEGSSNSNIKKTVDGHSRLVSMPAQVAPETAKLAEFASLVLEFTRLSQITGNDKYFDAVERVTNLLAEQQHLTKLPGMWPATVNPQKQNLTEGAEFNIGDAADGAYEYLPKQYLLLGGALPKYRDMYNKALGAMKANLFYHPRIFTPRDQVPARMLLPGHLAVDPSRPLPEQDPEPRLQQRACSAGAMVGLAARAFSAPADLDVARQLAEGCLWAHASAPAGVMPEAVRTTRCPARASPCIWDEEAWLRDVADATATAVAAAKNNNNNEDEEAAAKRLPRGVVRYDDKRFRQHVHAVETVFVLFRLTGDAALRERAWPIFEAVVALTRTDAAHAAVRDCTAPDAAGTQRDFMESAWLASTLKYFFLLFSEPDVISLDEYVFNTAGHPFKIGQ